MNQTTVRQLFPMFENNPELVYLDSAATTQTPASVIERMTKYYKEERSNIHRGFYELAVLATDAYEDARATVANFIHAKPSEIIFTSGATDSINILARMLESEVTDSHNIVLTAMEHHANLIPWQQLAKRTGVELRFIPITDQYTLDYEAAQNLIDEHTRIVSFVHASNTLGTLNNIAIFTSLARTVGAYSIVDAAQSLAHVPIDVSSLQCDFLVASGHKVYGPTGIGILYGKQIHLDRLEPVQYGGDMIRSVTYDDAEWATAPEKFEAGTPPIAEALGLATACTFLKEHQDGLQREVELIEYAITSLEDVGAVIIGPRQSNNRIGVISFHIGDAHPHDVADILGKRGICVRAGHHCTMPLMKQLGVPGTVRASFGLYNTKADVDALLNGIVDVKQILQL